MCSELESSEELVVIKGLVTGLSYRTEVHAQGIHYFGGRGVCSFLTLFRQMSGLWAGLAKKQFTERAFYLKCYTNKSLSLKICENVFG